jgi:rhomboid family GlyGly-CTERM serine protease
MSALHLLIPDGTILYFSAADIVRGEVWRLVTGHLAHADLEHLFWNGLGLGVLGWLIERRSTPLLWLSLGSGIAAVNILLLSPFSHLHYYCGLSGVLNTLLVVALWLEWATSRSLLVGALAVGCVAKVTTELVLGAAILTELSWPAYPWSHLAGLIGGLLVVCCKPNPSNLRSISTKGCTSPTSASH